MFCKKCGAPCEEGQPLCETCCAESVSAAKTRRPFSWKVFNAILVPVLTVLSAVAVLLAGWQVDWAGLFGNGATPVGGTATTYTAMIDAIAALYDADSYTQKGTAEVDSYGQTVTYSYNTYYVADGDTVAFVKAEMTEADENTHVDTVYGKDGTYRTLYTNADGSQTGYRSDGTFVCLEKSVSPAGYGVRTLIGALLGSGEVDPAELTLLDMDIMDADKVKDAVAAFRKKGAAWIEEQVTFTQEGDVADGKLCVELDAYELYTEFMTYCTDAFLEDKEPDDKTKDRCEVNMTIDVKDGVMVAYEMAIKIRENGRTEKSSFDCRFSRVDKTTMHEGEVQSVVTLVNTLKTGDTTTACQVCGSKDDTRFREYNGALLCWTCYDFYRYGDGTCVTCGKYGEVQEHNGERYCADCYPVTVTVCDECGAEEGMYTYDGDTLCWACYDYARFGDGTCVDCGAYGDVDRYDGKLYCDDCHPDKSCDVCGTDNANYAYNGQVLCWICYDYARFGDGTCYSCGEYGEVEEYNGHKYCAECHPGNTVNCGLCGAARATYSYDGGMMLCKTCYDYHYYNYGVCTSCGTYGSVTPDAGQWLCSRCYSDDVCETCGANEAGYQYNGQTMCWECYDFYYYGDGYCDSCGAYGDVEEVNGQRYCSSCNPAYVCSVCGTGGADYERGGQRLCYDCYYMCEICGGSNATYGYSGQQICWECYDFYCYGDGYCDSCGAYGDVEEVNGQRYCFSCNPAYVCSVCGEGGADYERNGARYCYTCYYTCETCGASDASYEYDGKRMCWTCYDLYCWGNGTCDTCGTSTDVYEHGDQWLCGNCHPDYVCAVCGTARGEYDWEGQRLCYDCYDTCEICGGSGAYHQYEEQRVCTTCYDLYVYGSGCCDSCGAWSSVYSHGEQWLCEDCHPDYACAVCGEGGADYEREGQRLCYDCYYVCEVCDDSNASYDYNGQLMCWECYDFYCYGEGYCDSCGTYDSLTAYGEQRYCYECYPAA